MDVVVFSTAFSMTCEHMSTGVVVDGGAEKLRGIGEEAWCG